MIHDVVVVGSGPNGLVAAIRLAEAGARVVVLEAGATPGGGMRSGAVTGSGAVHDLCSSVHPLAVASPAFSELGLERHGLRWAHPAVQVAHPLDDGRAAAVRRSLDETIDELGPDGAAWRATAGVVARHWPHVAAEVLRPILHAPSHPLALLRVAGALLPATATALRFRTPAGRALWAGLAAHSTAPLESWGSSAAAVLLGGLAHVGGWPVAVGGSGSLAAALISRLEQVGGEIRLGHRVAALGDLPRHRVAVYDTGVGTLLDVYGPTLPRSYTRRLRRFRPGPASFKIDYALAEPIPWAAPACRAAGTIHVGGTLEEIASAERAPWEGHVAERPFVLVGQPTVPDPGRAPVGVHVAWAYCHVPNGWRGDHTEAIERQIERFAPGFRSVISERVVSTPADLESENSNYQGGDIAAGATRGLQMFARPVLAADPYRTPIPGVYLCSAATPPGAGVHGMGGHWAARSILARELR